LAPFGQAVSEEIFLIVANQKKEFEKKTMTTYFA
jgi:hypothetical protein